MTTPLDAAEELLTDPSLAGVVDLVLRRAGPGYRAAAARGSVDFRRLDGGFETVSTTGEPPLRHATDERVDQATEQADPWALLGAHATPYARANIAQLLDAPHGPDLAVLHAPRHRFHANAGEHGSLGLSQARAPFVAAGRGVQRLGEIDDHLRMIDVAPTLAALLGCPPIGGHDGAGRERSDVRLRLQDGDVRSELLTDEPPDHVIAFLLDGTNAGAMWAAMEQGAAPTIASVAERGTSYRHGVLAALPTATLANHTTALTGLLPGRSGIVHNTWFDREHEETVDLLQLEQMMTACTHLRPDAETVHEALHRADPRARTVSTFEYADRGADWSTFAEMRAGRRPPAADEPQRRRHRDPDRAELPEYKQMSVIDSHSAHQACLTWSGRTGALPRFTFVNFSLTDAMGHHGGPHSEWARAAITESDRRVGQVLDAVDAAGATARTAVVVFADHGMQDTADTDVTHLGALLDDAGIDHTLVDDQFLYLT